MRRTLALLLLIGCGDVRNPAIDASAPPPDASDVDAGDAAADAMADALVLPDGLVAWYRMDEPANKNAPDVTGAHDGTCVAANCPSFATAGRIDGAYAFNGQDQFFRVTSTAALQTPTGFTIAAWINRTPGSVGGCILSKVLGTGTDNSWQVCIGENKLTFFTSGQGAGQGQDVIDPLAAGIWHHIALWFDGSTNTKRFYVNGRLKAEDPGLVVNFDDGAIVLGCDFGEAGNPEFFYNGQIDDVRIYNRAISDDEIKALAEI